MASHPDKSTGQENLARIGVPRGARPSCWCHAGLWQGHCLSCGAPARLDDHWIRRWRVYLTLVVVSVLGYLLVGEFL